MKKITSISIISAIALVFLIPPPMHVFAQQPYVGEISFVGFNFAPNGYAFCNGQLLPINQYEVLFNLIGTTYGGDGQSTFALPNMQGRVPIHQGTGPGGQNFVIGQMGGAETHILTISQLPVHSPTLYTNSQANTKDPSGHVLARAWPQIYSTSTSNLVAMNPSSIGSIGGSQPFNTMQPYLAVNCIISLFGVFPSQN